MLPMWGTTPPLRSPILMAAFDGWNDAGEAASVALRHLCTVWGADLVGTVNPQDYYDFQVNRPRVQLVDGRREIIWPETRILVARNTSFDRDVVFVDGIEPSIRWVNYVTDLLNVATGYDVKTILTLGAHLAEVPHTRPLPVNVTSDDAALRDRFGAEVSQYVGPTGIVGVLASLADTVGIGTLSAWVSVPHYAGGPPSPKAALSLITTIEDLFEVPIPRLELEEEARAWELTVDEMAEAEEEVAEYVSSLEEAADAAELPEASGDALAREFERYLRGRQEG